MSFRAEGEILKQQPVVDKIIKPLEIQKSRIITALFKYSGTDTYVSHNALFKVLGFHHPYTFNLFVWPRVENCLY
jgi:hypothetical protein